MGGRDDKWTRERKEECEGFKEEGRQGRKGEDSARDGSSTILVYNTKGASHVRGRSPRRQACTLHAVC